MPPIFPVSLSWPPSSLSTFFLRCSAQNWTLYSSWGLTGAKWSRIIISYVLGCSHTSCSGCSWAGWKVYFFSPTPAAYHHPPAAGSPPRRSASTAAPGHNPGAWSRLEVVIQTAGLFSSSISQNGLRLRYKRLWRSQSLRWEEMMSNGAVGSGFLLLEELQPEKDVQCHLHSQISGHLEPQPHLAMLLPSQGVPFWHFSSPNAVVYTSSSCWFYNIFFQLSVPF